MDREYSVSVAGKIGYLFISSLLFGLGAQMLVWSSTFYGGVFALLFVAAGIYLFINNLFIRRIVISDSTITFIGLFIRKEIFFSDIKGFRLGYRRMSIVDNIDDVQPYYVYMYYKYGSNGDDFIDWLKQNFVDLDATDR